MNTILIQREDQNLPLSLSRSKENFALEKGLLSSFYTQAIFKTREEEEKEKEQEKKTKSPKTLPIPSISLEKITFGMEEKKKTISV